MALVSCVGGVHEAGCCLFWLLRRSTTLRPAPVVAGIAQDLFRTRNELVAENAALRQQLIVASRKVNFDCVAEGVGARILKTAIRAPLMNATCERFLGSVRRECLDHVIILGKSHLRTVLTEYAAFSMQADRTRG